MIRYAQIMNGEVATVIESATDPDGINGNWIACGDAGPGWLYADGVFTPPVAPQALTQRHTSVGAFFDRFGPLKWAILSSTDPMVQALVKDCSVRAHIDLDNDQLPGGLDMLVAAGYAIDKSAILNMPVLAKELP